MVAQEKAQTKYAVPALDKALDILELLSNNPASMSQVDIARALGRNTSEIYRILTALEARAYIRRTQGGQYRLTLKMFELSRTHTPYEELLRVAAPLMRNLSEKIEETCHLTMMKDGEIVVLAQHESPSPMRLSIAVGSRHSPLSTTSGRLILSSMTDAERADCLTNYTEFDTLPEDVRLTLLTRVKSIAERGYEISDGERFVGGLDLGVLIGHPNSKTKAALIVATLQRADGPNAEKIIPALLETGRKITELTGLGSG